MRTPTRFFALTPLCLVLLCAPVFAQMKLRSSVFAGGTAAATNGTALVVGTIGQAIVGPVYDAGSMVGQGFWYMLPVLSTTDVHFDPHVAESAVTLHQNIPNPFSGTTTLTFDLPKGGYVSLAVFDAIGNHVRTVLDGTRDAGRTTIALNAEGLESGSYTVRLIAGTVTRTIMMVVVR